MKKVATITVPDFIFTFYEKIGEGAGIPAEQVMADMLLRMAGELSLQALHEEGIEPEDIRRSANERYGLGLDDEIFDFLRTIPHSGGYVLLEDPLDQQQEDEPRKP